MAVNEHSVDRALDDAMGLDMRNAGISKCQAAAYTIRFLKSLQRDANWWQGVVISFVLRQVQGWMRKSGC